MGVCVCLPRCPLFAAWLYDMSPNAKLMKTRYCLGESKRCARNMVVIQLGPYRAPQDLEPTQHQRAREILVASRRRGAGRRAGGSWPWRCE